MQLEGIMRGTKTRMSTQLGIVVNKVNGYNAFSTKLRICTLQEPPDHTDLSSTVWSWPVWTINCAFLLPATARIKSSEDGEDKKKRIKNNTASRCEAHLRRGAKEISSYIFLYLGSCGEALPYLVGRRGFSLCIFPGYFAVHVGVCTYYCTKEYSTPIHSRPNRVPSTAVCS